MEYWIVARPLAKNSARCKTAHAGQMTVTFSENHIGPFATLRGTREWVSRNAVLHVSYSVFAKVNPEGSL